jgi:hypothetical protein
MAVSVEERPDHENIDQTRPAAIQNRNQRAAEDNAVQRLSSRIRENSDGWRAWKARA